MLRLASKLADTGDLQLPDLDTLVAVQVQLMACIELTAEDLAEHLLRWNVLTQGVISCCPDWPLKRPPDSRQK